MAEKLLMLALSPTMENGTIANWLKKEGDKIGSGDIICEVETDKATMELDSHLEGTLLKIVINNGETAEIGQLIGVIGKEGEDISSILEEKQAAPKPKAKNKESKSEDAPAAKTTTPPSVSNLNEKVKSSPLARKIAVDEGLDINQIQGSGPGGRVIKKDVLAAKSTTSPASGSINAPAGDIKIPHTQKRKIIASRLGESKFSAPHFYLKTSIEMDAMMGARKSLNAKFKEKISVNAFLMKVLAQALVKHPVVNSSWQDDHILQFGSVDIGLAVAQKDGLITPIVRNCAAKGIRQIDIELKELIEKARNNTLQPNEFTGATFTISSLGSFGIEEFTAIINPPGSAILAIGEMKKTPVVVENDEIEIKTLMKTSLSCDHRVIDGAVGAAFLTEVKGMLENPFSALY